MGKNKLKKFAEMETFSNVFQCGAREMLPSNQVHEMAGHWRELFFHNDHPFRNRTHLNLFILPGARNIIKQIIAYSRINCNALFSFFQY